MKSKKKSILIILSSIVAILVIVYFVFFKGIYAFSDKFVDVYSDAENYEEFLSYEPWQIGANKYGEAVFCYKDNALAFIKLKYGYLINKVYVQNEQNISKFNKNNISSYIDLLKSFKPKNEEESNSTKSLIKLLELYENGEKRWIYIIGSGWRRIYK